MLQYISFLLVFYEVVCYRRSSHVEPSCPVHERYVVDDVSCIRTCRNRLSRWDTMGACVPYTGCACNINYFRKYDDGTGPCIPEEQCRELLLRGTYKIFVDFFIACPLKYCPIDDNQAVCDVAYHCSGFMCRPGYLMLSHKNPRYIKSSKCPRIICRRPNEEWHPAPPSCYTDSCGDAYWDCRHSLTGPPRCVCKSGFCRNKRDICVPISYIEIGCNGDPNAIPHSCPSSCPPTCDEPNSRGNMCIAACDPSGCVCKSGYILTKKHGRCVQPKDCPEIGCNGDPNAIPHSCPSSCPPTCDEPNSRGNMCIAACDPSGCVCKSGFILTKKHGRCVQPKDCPVIGCNGDPNAIPHSCPSSCPPTCDEPNSRGNMCIAACDPSGCVCKPGYILTKKHGRCVKPKYCPDMF